MPAPTPHAYGRARRLVPVAALSTALLVTGFTQPSAASPVTGDPGSPGPSPSTTTTAPTSPAPTETTSPTQPTQTTSPTQPTQTTSPTQPTQTTSPTQTSPAPATAPAPGPSHARERRAAPAGIALNKPDPVFEDHGRRVEGQLPAGSHQEQVILDRLVGHQWHRRAATTSKPDGSFSFTVHFAQPGPVSLRARYTATPAQGKDGDAQTSNTVKLTVKNRFVHVSTHRRYLTFGNIVARGTVRPATKGTKVVIQRHRGGRWVSIGRARSHSDGTWHTSMPNRQAGRWHIRATTPGSRPRHGTRELTRPRGYVVAALLHPVITHVTKRQLGGSYHEGCPVGPAQLRNVRLTFKTYGPTVNRGTLVVRSGIVGDVRTVWRRSLRARFPFNQIRPTAYYGGSDPKSMLHDNTSAFNCRHVTGDPTSLSPHSYGTAIDINTVKNPYMDSSGHWWPHHKGIRYRNRSHRHPGMLFDRSLITRMMRSRGYQWGGSWYHHDYQHFDPR